MKIKVYKTKSKREAKFYEWWTKIEYNTNKVSVKKNIFGTYIIKVYYK